MVRPEYELGHYVAAILALLLGLVGVLTIVGLFTAWRRYNARLRQRELPEQPAGPDPWETAGRRLAADHRDDPLADPSDDAPPSPQPPPPRK